MTIAEHKQWFDDGVKQGATHMIIWCDTFDYEDYPEYMTTDAFGARMHVQKTNGMNMRLLMEVFNLRMDRDQQFVGMKRAFNY